MNIFKHIILFIKNRKKEQVNSLFLLTCSFYYL